MVNLEDIRVLGTSSDAMLPLDYYSALVGASLSLEQIKLGKLRIKDGVDIGKGLLNNLCHWTDSDEWQGALTQLNELEKCCGSSREQIRSLVS